MAKLTNSQVLKLIEKGTKLPLATQNYPSRGQTAIQELYQTKKGRLFLKRPSLRNHKECQINIDSGTLAEREYWSFKLASHIGLEVPLLWLIDQQTTVQAWLNYPDALQFTTSQGKLTTHALNIFECGLFDWLTGQVDRHNANYLYNFADEKIILIDSAHCFLKYTGSIPHYLELFEVGYAQELNKKILSPIKNKITDLTEPTIKKLIPLRDNTESEALINRLDEIKNATCINDLIHLYRKGKK
ncbi:MAG TPA: hypothetical protein DDW49_06685 [Deltaproteobacteria bacterium]|nr:MAG: hypothetical protein A2048_04770 [Deltaproteobacteria bacterium GWA2_45_12]HBF13057.1 hypothetical protein [Deltaproteobacteria bacterium]